MKKKIDKLRVFLGHLALRPRLFSQMSDAHVTYLEGITFLREEAQRTSNRVDAKAVRELWVAFMKRAEEVLTEYYKPLVDIAARPEYAQYALPDPATWAYRYLQMTYSDIEWDTLRKIIPPLVELLNSDATHESLLFEFQGIDQRLKSLVDSALLQLAGRGWKPSGDSGADRKQLRAKRPTAKVPKLRRSSCRFGLADVADPPDGLSKHRVVHELHPFFWKAIKEQRSWFRQETTRGHNISPKDIAERCLLLKDATNGEIQKYVFENPQMTASEASWAILASRGGFDDDTAKHYSHTPPRDKKSRAVATSSSTKDSAKQSSKKSSFPKMGSKRSKPDKGNSKKKQDE